MDIDATNYKDALPLLTKGFANTTAQFWQSGIERLLTSPVHAEGGEPIGHFIIADGEAVGLALLTTSDRFDETGAKTHRIVNFSAWYLEPDHRWRMPLLLNKCMADKSAIYTDLTPAPHVVPILETLGFEQINRGVELINGPVAAANIAGAGKLATWRDSPLADGPEWRQRLFADHERLGCYVWALEIDGKTTPLILKAIVKARLPVATVIYCEEPEMLERATSVVARALLKRGRIGLIVDAPQDRPARTGIDRVGFPNKLLRFMKNGAPNGPTDFAYSELVFFEQ